MKVSADGYDSNYLSKFPQITVLFWLMKICATTLGETAGDLFSMTLDIGYALSSIFLLLIFLATLVLQLRTKRFHPLLYWTVILSTSTAGTTVSDYMDRTLGLGYATGSGILVAILCAVLFYWHRSEKTLSVENIRTRKAEVFYWTAILFSNTLGTALGDFLADSSGLGFAGGALLISGLLALVVLAYFHTRISHVLLFWLAFVLTRPLGATAGDLLTKPLEKGGFGFGTYGSSTILLSLLVVCIVCVTWQARSRMEPT